MTGYLSLLLYSILHQPIFVLFTKVKVLSPGQTDSQVDASFGLAFSLATHLRWLTKTCVDFGRAQIWMQVDASFLPFGHPTQVNTSWSQVICCYKNTLTNDMREIYGFLWLASPLVNLFATHRKSAQVLVLQTCVDLWVRLARALEVFWLKEHVVKFWPWLQPFALITWFLGSSKWE